MTLSHKIIVAVLVIMLASSISASADWTKTSYLTGTLATGQNLQCDAVVSLLNGVYTYNYTLTFVAGASEIHTYKVYNTNYSGFFNAANGDGFTNPTSGNASQISWINGVLAPGHSCSFSYQSYYAPMEIDVYTYAVDTGKSATGKTIGMGALIPEPSSIVALFFGGVALVPFARRRK